MDDFGMLARDFGFRPQGKSAPMKSDGVDFRSRPPSSSSSPSPSPSPFAAEENQIFNDVFGGPPKFTTNNNNNNNSRSTSPMSDIDYDSIFKNSASTNSNNEPKSKSMSSNLPVYDKPVYDDDIFDGLPGMKSKSMHSASAKYDDNIFASMAASPPKRNQQSDHFDDLLGNLGRTEKVEPPKNKTSKSSRGLDDLLPGFGSGGPVSSSRSSSESAPVSTGSTKETSNGIDDPFVVLESTSTPATSSQGVFIDPLETIHRFSKSASTNAGGSSVNGGIFDDLDPLHGFGKPAPAFQSETDKGMDQGPFKEGLDMGSSKSSTRKEPTEKSSFPYSENQSQKVPLEDFQETIFDMPAASKISQRSVDQTTSPPSYTETSSQADMSPKSEEYVQPAGDIWLTVSEIPLFTQPTRAPPPSRPPPPIPRHASKFERGSFASNTRTVGNDYSASPNSTKYPQSFNPFQPAPKTSMASPSPLDEFDNFAMGGMPNNNENDADAQYGEEMDSNSAAAAMKDAMDRAEAKFKHAKEVREREHAKASRNKESAKLQKDEMSMEEDSKRERQERERQQREREEQSRLEKERMREMEREKARQAVERATREARERAAIEAREKASAEARLKSERAAVQRAQAEARERAAIDARGRAERAAQEARERASAETSERAAAEAREKAAREKAAVARAEADARRRAERIAVERVAAEARERAALDARDRAAAAARMNQQKNENDLESFFSMGSRPSSAPRPRTASESATDPLSQNRRGQEGVQRTSTTSNMRKASSTTNIVDDLSSIFGAAAPSSNGGFQDVEGETEERRRARLERHQRTQDRAAKALEEKNQRDLQSQREQEERSRIGDTLDSEIKRWAAGKEGNLRALLSTLQYVLWPGCGWQPLSLTDLITGANVKKAYRKATLCIHPDKVQQKGATLQQKYVAEKVFDLLKEAWNKFNSEELF